MAAVRDEEFAWSQFLLALMSLGFLAVAAVSLVGDLFALDPEDRVPYVEVLTPAGVAVCGLALAAIGGRVASAVSAVLGALVAAAAVWVLAEAGPSEWLSDRFSLVFFLVVLVAAAVGVAAVAIVLRNVISARTRPPVLPAGRPDHQMRLVDGIRQVLSWLVVGALVAITAAAGWSWYQRSFVTPMCGDVADTQLTAAMLDMERQIPGLRFTDVETSCDSVFQAYARWEHQDVQKLVADARAAGCIINEQATYNEDEQGFLTCSTSGRPVIFTLELIDSVPPRGSMTMA